MHENDLIARIGELWEEDAKAIKRGDIHLAARHHKK